MSGSVNRIYQLNSKKSTKITAKKGATIYKNAAEETLKINVYHLFQISLKAESLKNPFRPG